MLGQVTNRGDGEADVLSLAAEQIEQRVLAVDHTTGVAAADQDHLLSTFRYTLDDVPVMAGRTGTQLDLVLFAELLDSLTRIHLAKHE